MIYRCVYVYADRVAFTLGFLYAGKLGDVILSLHW